MAPIPKSPTGKRFTTAVPNVWVINEASPPEVKEAAWRWIKHQISEEAQLLRMASGSGVLVNRRVGSAFLPAYPDRLSIARFSCRATRSPTHLRKTQSGADIG